MYSSREGSLLWKWSGGTVCRACCHLASPPVQSNGMRYLELCACWAIVGSGQIVFVAG